MLVFVKIGSKEHSRHKLHNFTFALVAVFQSISFAILRYLIRYFDNCHKLMYTLYFFHFNLKLVLVRYWWWHYVILLSLLKSEIKIKQVSVVSKSACLRAAKYSCILFFIFKNPMTIGMLVASQVFAYSWWYMMHHDLIYIFYTRIVILHTFMSISKRTKRGIFHCTPQLFCSFKSSHIHIWRQ